MHECPECGMACDCDGEDVWNDAPPDCNHECDIQYDEGDDDMSDESEQDLEGLQEILADQKKAEDEMNALEQMLRDELETLMADASEGECPKLNNDIQPPTSIIALAAASAAKVFMAFERGYRMG